MSTFSYGTRVTCARARAASVAASTSPGPASTPRSPRYAAARPSESMRGTLAGQDSLLDRDDDLGARVPVHRPHRLVDLGEIEPLLDHWPHLTGLDHLAQHSEIVAVRLRDEE